MGDRKWATSYEQKAKAFAKKLKNIIKPNEDNENQDSI